MFRPLVPSKRKSDENLENDTNKRQHTARQSLGASSLQNINYGVSRNGSAESNSKTTSYFSVQWRKPQTKKHKTWDGDAVMTVQGSKLTLQDVEGKFMGSGSCSTKEGVDVGQELYVGGKQVEVESVISSQDYLSGRCFGSGGLTAVEVPVIKPAPISQGFKAPLALSRKSSFPSVISRPSAKASPVPARAKENAPPPKSPGISIAANSRAARYYTANWRKPQNKVHKTWDGDAYLVVTGQMCAMQDTSGKPMGAAVWKPDWTVGDIIHIGGKEVQIDSCITSKEFQSMSSGTPAEAEDVPANLAVPSVSFYGLARTGKAPRPEQKPKVVEPRHDPEASGAFILPKPSEAHQAKFNKNKGPVVDVVVDPLLAVRLRPHQKEGVTFMYEAVMGMRRHEGMGAILADEMGLGKTLQTITLIWTLLKQSPYGGQTVGKAMIVCPVSLVTNWRNEFIKWLGRDRVGIFMGDKDKSHIKQFIHSRNHHVLIIGYEKLRSVIKDLAYCQPPIDLIVCDEGHRLKSANNKTSKMFEALKTSRRIILSGTPIQNDLSEFWSMADFCNPGLLDDYNTFKRLFEQPIVKSRTPGCSNKDKELGEGRSQQLAQVSKSFVLRRTAEILSSYLPPKYEYVVFIRPTALQLTLMTSILNADRVNRLIRGGMAQSLAVINTLGKICASPVLLKLASASGKQPTDEDRDMLKLLPPGVDANDISISGKMIALTKLLETLRNTTEEKAIIVSQYTQTLNVIEAICNKNRFSFCRLDGSTPQPKRMELVNSFNRTPQASCFLFLLSAKAGGVGLNLVGASRLILLDSSWNPSVDLQAMARIHRDGQKRPVHIYRFLTAGTIDEKIYMRQVVKMGLSDSLIGNKEEEKSKGDSFSPEELRDLFRVHPHTGSHTHDLLGCTCAADAVGEADSEEGDGSIVLESDDDEEPPTRGWMLASQVNVKQQENTIKKKKAELAALDEWTHINCMTPTGREDIPDTLLRSVVSRSYGKTIEDAGRSRMDRLLAAIDMNNIPQAAEGGDDEEKVDMSAVAGGSVTFLFTRSSG